MIRYLLGSGKRGRAKYRRDGFYIMSAALQVLGSVPFGFLSLSITPRANMRETGTRFLVQ
jgi:hypothetical protein